MQKIACVFSFKESSWVSCQKIVFNLHEAWAKVPNCEILNFNFDLNDETGDSRPLANEIFSAMPDIISIIDHRPHPYYFLRHLLPLYSGMKKRPKIILHVFGDFTLNYDLWDKLAPIMKDFHIKFIVASPRQKLLIDRILGTSESIVCPFPVNQKDFYYDPALRGPQRSKWALSDRDTAFIFTGRLSRQKRIKTMIKTFSEEFANESSAHLFIYGTADNIGDPFMGIHETENEYFRKFFRFYKELPTPIQKRIHFMGAVPNKELLPVYMGADFLINLSVHNDEDYGMSVAEAQATGLPSLLTDWGGLAGFEHEELPWATTFVPVVIGNKSKLMSGPKVRSALRKCFETKNHSKRAELGQLALKKFGVKNSGEILTGVISSPFQEFSSFGQLFRQITIAQASSSFLPVYRTRANNINDLYRRIYSAYVR